ncbi:DNA polymerase catalytic subunit [Cyprinid herpesvirus 3]|nr:DNA polymerase catalytic subunit [Cyprinid herpesvirus 3]
MQAFKLYEAFSDYLPKQVTEQEFDRGDGDNELMYVASVRLIEESFRVWACWPDSGRKKCFWIRPVWWPCVMSDRVYELVGRSKPFALASTRSLPQVGGVWLNNADTKQDVRCRLILFKNKRERQVFINLLRKEFPNDADVGTFEGSDSDMMGMAECILNRFLCCHFYRAPGFVSDPASDNPVISLNELWSCDAADESLYNVHFNFRDEVLLRKLKEAGALGRQEEARELEAKRAQAVATMPRRLVPELVYRCAFFDIECVFDSDHLDPNLDVGLDPTFAADLKIEARVKSCFIKDFLPPRNTSNLRGYKEVTSVSLVYGGNERDQATGRKVEKKIREVWYNAARVQGPGPIKDDSCGDVVTLNGVLTSCASELEMLVRFMRAVRDHCDVLFVFNYDFDVMVITSRVNFYRSVYPEDPLTSELVELFEQAFSKDPRMVPADFTFLDNKHNACYSELLDTIDKHKEGFFAACRKAGAARDERGCLVITRTHVSDFFPYQTAWKKFMDNKQLNSTMRSLGVYIVDLMKVNNTKSVKSGASRFVKLETVANTIISKSRPFKCPHKAGKIKGVAYHEMDAMFFKGGKDLWKYLMYNLADSELLARITRFTRPHIEFVCRVRATFGLDYVSLGREKVEFSGAMVQSTKSVEAPLLYSKVRIGRFVAAGKNFASVAMGGKYASIDYRRNIKVKGGKVFQPLLGMTYTGPYIGTVCTYDFASLYPSNMCDGGISPESIVSKMDPFCLEYVRNTVMLDWKKIPAASNMEEIRDYPHSEDLYTILCYKNKEVGWVRFETYTASSLNHYLSMRSQYKKRMKTEKDAGLKAYYDQMQGEMKVCANSHYGVAQSLCQHLTTWSGRQKILLVETAVKKTPGMTVVYGDTDSVMYQCPPAEMNPLDVDTVREDVSAEAVNLYTKGKTREEGETVQRILRDLNDRLYEFMAERMVYVDDQVNVRPLSRCPETKHFYLTDSVDGQRVYLKDIFDRTLITNLAYENTATVSINMAKKNYIYTNHELEDGVLTKTKEKLRGVQAIKNNAAGATRDFNNDMVYACFRGWAIVYASTFGNINGMISYKSWGSVREGDDVYFCTTAPEFDEWHACTNYEKMVCEWCRVVSCLTEPAASSAEYSMHRLVLRKPDGVEFKYVCASDSNNFNMTHTFSLAEQIRRDAVALNLIKFRYWSASAGFTSWRSLIQYSGLQTFKQESLKVTFNEYGAVNTKNNKVAYVTVETLCRVDAEYKKQVPILSFLKGFRFDVKQNVMDRDMWGSSSIHLHDLTVDDLMAALEWPDVIRDAEWRGQSEEAVASDERQDSEQMKLLRDMKAGELARAKAKKPKRAKKGTMDAFLTDEEEERVEVPPLRTSGVPAENHIARDRRVPPFHPMALKHALSLAAVTEDANYGVHLLFDMFVPKTGKVPVGWPLRTKLERGLAFVRDTYDHMRLLKDKGQAVFSMVYSTPVKTDLLDDVDFEETFVRPVNFGEDNVMRILTRPEIMRALLDSNRELLAKKLSSTVGKFTHENLRVPACLRELVGARLVPYTGDPTDKDTIQLCENLYQYRILLGAAKNYCTAEYDRHIQKVDWTRADLGLETLECPPAFATHFELKVFFRRRKSALDLFKRQSSSPHSAASSVQSQASPAHCDFCGRYWSMALSGENASFAKFVSDQYEPVRRLSSSCSSGAGTASPPSVLLRRKVERVCLQEFSQVSAQQQASWVSESA